MLQDIGGANRSYDVIVGPAFQDIFERTLKVLDIEFDVMIEDLQA